jgi:ActR/RegA family two-component response regulator
MRLSASAARCARRLVLNIMAFRMTTILLQRRMHEIDSDMLVIMMTGYASVETAVAALKNGATITSPSHSIPMI